MEENNHHELQCGYKRFYENIYKHKIKTLCAKYFSQLYIKTNYKLNININLESIQSKEILSSCDELCLV